MKTNNNVPKNKLALVEALKRNPLHLEQVISENKNRFYENASLFLEQGNISSVLKCLTEIKIEDKEERLQLKQAINSLGRLLIAHNDYKADSMKLESQLTWYNEQFKQQTDYTKL